MAETVTLIADDGMTEPGRAEVIRFTSAGRVTKAVIFVVAGLLAGGACIVVPGLHLITTWALPLLGVILGMRAWKGRAEVHDVAGTCPACEQPIEPHGGRISDEPLSTTCPRCRSALRIAIL